MIPLDSFMAHSADGRLVPVVPGGQNISLTFSNRTEYVEKALDYRLHEMDSQVRRNKQPRVQICHTSPDKSSSYRCKPQGAAVSFGYPEVISLFHAPLAVPRLPSCCLCASCDRVWRKEHQRARSLSQTQTFSPL